MNNEQQPQTELCIILAMTIVALSYFSKMFRNGLMCNILSSTNTGCVITHSVGTGPVGFLIMAEEQPIGNYTQQNSFNGLQCR